ncbi:hypothetical protein D8S78_14240 [Natrialba swarupiae]|nr:hypothetical protein [Natrialba swarupiae]
MVFNGGVDWEQTPYYSRMKDWVSQDGSYKGMKDTAELDRRCEQPERLYMTIKRNGYTTQCLLTEQKLES